VRSQDSASEQFDNVIPRVAYEEALGADGRGLAWTERTTQGELRYDTEPGTSWLQRMGVEWASMFRSSGCSGRWRRPTGARLGGRGLHLLDAARFLLVVSLAGMLAAAAIAAPLSPLARSEIDGLMSRLDVPGCAFNRNGIWYTGAEAKSHLLRKLQYLEERGAVQSAEQFIELAATSSSMSGQPYLVRCDNGAPVPSGTWLRTQLQKVRQARPARNVQ